MTELVYEVAFKGTASDALRAAFDGCEVQLGHGLTVLSCNPAHLRVVLEQLESLGLELLEVRLVAGSPSP